MPLLTRPGPCPYCDKDPVLIDRCVCVGVETSDGQRYYDCVLFREWWDAGHAAGARSERAAQELQESIDRINAVPWEPPQ